MASAKWRPFCLGLNVLTHWLLRDVAAILKVWLSYKIVDHSLLNCYEVSATEPCKYIEAKTKWPPISNYIFTCIFLNENV